MCYHGWLHYSIGRDVSLFVKKYFFGGELQLDTLCGVLVLLLVYCVYPLYCFFIIHCNTHTHVNVCVHIHTRILLYINHLFSCIYERGDWYSQLLWWTWPSGVDNCGHWIDQASNLFMVHYLYLAWGVAWLGVFCFKRSILCTEFNLCSHVACLFCYIRGVNLERLSLKPRAVLYLLFI